MEEKKPFTPYIPAHRITPELTVTSVLVGVVLAVIFGAANAYLGLRVGMTVSASIPAAVIAMGVIRVALRRDSILECNIVQTVGSAGESVAAGAIFTLPALFLWAKEGVMESPSLPELTLIALLGGLLGVFFMVPLRNALIVREHGVLPYPEGQACAQVMLAGEKDSGSTASVFVGMGVGALFKLVVDGLKLVPGEVNLQGSVKTYPGAIGTQIYPAVMSVGYICGPRIASYMFAGGIVSWLVLIPLIVLLGGETVLYPGTVPVGELFAAGGAGGIWSTYVRYIGAGALAAGGIISLIRSMPLIFRTFRDAIGGFSVGAGGSTARTEQNFHIRTVLVAILVLTLAVWLIPVIPVSFVGAVIVVLFGFFFATVSSRMVGLVGSSNNPVSGMAIATLLLATLVLKLVGQAGATGMQGAIAIGSIICIVAAIAGDTSQDLKTGYLLGATPKKQQMGEIIGVVAASLAIGATLFLLDRAWGFGSEELAAPQATLMKLVVEGIMGGNLPWGLILTGVFLAVASQLLGVPVLPFAIGLYLPVQLNACILVGGIVRLFFDRIKASEHRQAVVNRGILYCSGMIAGEGLVGILLAVLAIFGVDIALQQALPERFAPIGGLTVFALLVSSLVWFALRGKKKEG
ncbi:MAG: oligopeptide transporter, OPT family [Clostridia bacterium]|nr:oligopeptide transporter, OPT family [Clostridia bacterium]